MLVGEDDDTADGQRCLVVQRVGSDTLTDLSADSPASDSDPAFSPDGSLIAFRSTRGGVGGIFVMGPLGESVRSLRVDGYGPVFTPDSTAGRLSSRRSLPAIRPRDAQVRPNLDGSYLTGGS